MRLAKCEVIEVFNDHTMQVSIDCPSCHRPTIINITEDEAVKLGSDLLIQDALPTREAEECELFLTGLCFRCQQKIFGNRDE